MEIVCRLEKCNYFCIRFIGQPLEATGKDGAFVYRLVLKIFILAR